MSVNKTPLCIFGINVRSSRIEAAEAFLALSSSLTERTVAQTLLHIQQKKSTGAEFSQVLLGKQGIFQLSTRVHDKVRASSRKEGRLEMSARDKRRAQMQIRLQKMRV